MRVLTTQEAEDARAAHGLREARGRMLGSLRDLLAETALLGMFLSAVLHRGEAQGAVFALLAVAVAVNKRK